MIVNKIKGIELDTGDEITGYYYEEAGYWMNNGVPDYNKPVTRHKVVDCDGIHRDICPSTIVSINA